MKVLILGNGYIGNHLATELRDQTFASDQIHIVSKNDLNYTDYSTLKEALKTYEPTCVINSSGYTGNPNVDACEKDPDTTYKLNVVVPLDIARACDVTNTKLINIGSGCIFNSTNEYRLIETTTVPNFGIDCEYPSVYRTSKHACEENLKDFPCYQWRIRMPFCDQPVPKNYLWKLFKYDNLISYPNSLTSVKDLGKFALPFIHDNLPHGIYHAVNYGFATAADIISFMEEQGMKNPNWEIVDIIKTAVVRSNCVLSTAKEMDLGIQMPPLVDSLMRDIKILSDQCNAKE